MPNFRNVQTSLNVQKTKETLTISCQTRQPHSSSAAELPSLRSHHNFPNLACFYEDLQGNLG